jgi:hypothetical protein
MFSEEKINAVKEYLKSEFPDHSLHDRFDFDREAQTFRLLQDQDNELKLVTVAREFIEAHAAGEISVILNRLQLSKYFHNAKNKNRMIVTSKEITFE